MTVSQPVIYIFLFLTAVKRICLTWSEVAGKKGEIARIIENEGWRMNCGRKMTVAKDRFSEIISCQSGQEYLVPDVSPFFSN